MRALPALFASILLCAPLLAQEGGGVHAPRGSDQPTGEEPEAEKGPNLQIPAWIGGATKKRLEAAIAKWEAAFAQVKREGRRGLPKVLESIAALEAVQPLDAQSGLADYYLGIARQITGENELAVEHLEQAIKRQPRFHEAYVELGDAYRWVEQERKAEEKYDEALEVAPDYAHAYYMRALLRVAQQKHAEARADAATCLELEPEHKPMRELKKKLDLVLDGPDWPEKFEKETRHYVIRTNVSQEFCDEIAEQAELVHRLYRGIFPSSRSANKSPIVVFKTKREYHQNGGPQGAGGHFDPSFKQLFLFQYDNLRDTHLVLYHEGFHQFLDGIMPAHAPQWFNEGLADYFGPSEHVKEGRKEGMRIQPNPWRLNTIKRMIRSGDYLPFERLINMSQAEMYNPQRAGKNYAQAWSMVYFLAESEGRAHFKYLKDYFKALRKGKNQRQAFDASFGKADLEAMTEAWKEFIGNVDG